MIASYIVEETGKVFSLKSDRYLKSMKDKDGYLVVKAKGKLRKVHRLVAEVHIPNPLGLPEVNHKDFDRTNNHKDNLEWCTRKDNVKHSSGRQKAACSKTYKLRSPEGAVITVTNLSGFCKERGLDLSNMHKAATGKIRSKVHGYSYAD